MRVLIQRKQDRFYLAPGGKWTAGKNDARGFETSIETFEIRAKIQEETQLVFNFGDDETYDFTIK